MKYIINFETNVMCCQKICDPAVSPISGGAHVLRLHLILVRKGVFSESFAMFTNVNCTYKSLIKEQKSLNSCLFWFSGLNLEGMLWLIPTSIQTWPHSCHKLICQILLLMRIRCSRTKKKVWTPVLFCFNSSARPGKSNVSQQGLEWVFFGLYWHWRQFLPFFTVHMYYDSKL